MRLVTSLVFAIAIIGACSDDRQPTEPAATASSSSVTSTRAAGGSVPVELQGVWQTMLPNGDHATLGLQADSYRISLNGDTGSGTVSADGDVLSFTTNLCDGVGTYHWSLAGNRLTLMVIGTDPCPRSDVLQAAMFDRMS